MAVKLSISNFVSLSCRIKKAHPHLPEEIPEQPLGQQLIPLRLRRTTRLLYQASEWYWPLSLSYISYCRLYHPSFSSVFCLQYRPVCLLQGILHISLQACQRLQFGAIQSSPVSGHLYLCSFHW